MNSIDEERASRRRKRLWGAVVFIAFMIIVLPLLLDFAGNDSQFRRVEKLREEPPRVVDAQGNSQVQPIPERPANKPANVPESEPGSASMPASEPGLGLQSDSGLQPDLQSGSQPARQSESERVSDPQDVVAQFRPEVVIVEQSPGASIKGSPDYLNADSEVREALQQSRDAAPLTAWVVQTGSFKKQGNAVKMRDQLRSAGFASFVRDREPPSELYRVLVGPMISKQSATTARKKVAELLGVEALVLTYP